GKTRKQDLSGNVWEGIFSVFKHFKLFIRSSIIGTVIGIIPGIGATVASFVAYGQAVQTSKNQDDFGKGDVRGVLAPEAANDAKDGGSLVPTLMFGFPGSEGTALLLLALTAHGLIPGKELMTDHLDLVFVLIWSLFLSNWITSILGIAIVNPLAHLTVIKTKLLSPVIFVFTTLGAYVYRERVEDIVLAFLFGFIGYYMKKYEWPRAPLVISLVLGTIFETNFHITLQLHQLGRINFWVRPIAMALLGFTFLGLILSSIQSGRKHEKGK
ncbi:tripartite tricarboxylate transporter permease, partial [Thermodesulfobacteriota bacterium]